MRVLFLHLNIRTRDRQGYMYQVGCASIMSTLKAAGHEVEFVSVVDPDFREIDRQLKDFHPGITGIYAVGPMEKFLKRLARHLKKILPDTLTVAGGPHPTICPHLLDKTPDLDAVFRGDGELQMRELASRIENKQDFLDLDGFVFRSGNNIINNRLSPLLTEEQVRELPLPFRGDGFKLALDNLDHIAHFIFSRGCPYRCTYCSNHALNEIFGGYKSRFRTVQQALEEIDDAVSRFDIRSIVFDDDLMTVKPAWFEAFMKGYAQSFHLPFFANVRVGTVTPDQFQLMKEAGCSRIQIGIESGDLEIRQKVLGRKIGNREIIDTFQAAHDKGLETMSFNMVGLPFETPEAFENTIEINARIAPNTPGLHVFYPYEGTEAWKICHRENWIGQEDDDFVERTDTILQMPGFTREQIRYYFQNFYRLVREKVETIKDCEEIDKQPKISVIVCTYNRSDVLPGCLEALAKQRIGKKTFEVLVINNNSTDQTPTVVSEYTKRYANIKTFFESQQGLSHARNLGLKKASAEYVAFIDDDARVGEDWLENALKIIDEQNPDIFGGPAEPLFPEGKPEWFKDEYGVRGDMGETGLLEKGFIVGTNIFFRKSLLEEYGGFDPELGMKGDNLGYHEETELVFRAFKEKKIVFFSKDLKVKDVLPDYKKSFAFFILSKFKGGTYGEKIWKREYEPAELWNLIKLLNDTMDEFDHALLRRDKTKHRYPENYLVDEKILDNFFYLGQGAAYFSSLGPEKFRALFSRPPAKPTLWQIATEAVKNKQAGRLLYKLAVAKIKSIFKRI